MIFTLTLNPSIDYVVHLDRFESGITNRTTGEEYYIGGKGLNVSFMLAELGIESTAFGFTAGFTGAAIAGGILGKGIRSDFIRLQNGLSRINIKIKAEQESEINCQGPDISESEFIQLLRKVEAIKDGDTIVLAGSIPKTMSDDTYVRILKHLGGKDVRIVVDATKKLLMNCLPYRPFLIKPNRQELSEMFKTTVETAEQTETCARELMKMGARNVIVSLGGQGAVLFAEDGKTYRTGVLKEKVVSTVGSGDSMVAGFIAGYEQKKDYGYALKLGTACGNATAFSAGIAKKEKVMEVLEKITVNEKNN